MPVNQMFALHPEAADESDQALAAAAQQAMFCAAICTSCVDACLAESADMQQCIRICLDTADICSATARLAARRTGHNPVVLRATLELCTHACERSAEDCSRHPHAHCQLCARTCRECAEACRRALPTVH